jgi:hypothetical protein
MANRYTGGVIPAHIQKRFDRQQQLERQHLPTPTFQFDPSKKYLGFCIGYAQIKVGDLDRVRKELADATTEHSCQFNRIRLGKQRPTPQQVARIEAIFHSLGIFDIWDE